MSKRLNTIVKVTIGCLGIVVCWALWPRIEEPEYQGKKLSKWLIEWRASDSTNVMETADTALHQIGTNALPWLLKWLRYQEPQWKENLYSLSKSPIKINWLEQKLWPGRPTRPDFMAMAGFYVLGTNASPAIPELTWLVRTSQVNQTRSMAMRAVVLAGGPLEPFMTNTDPWIRMRATNMSNSLKGIKY